MWSIMMMMMMTVNIQEIPSSIVDIIVMSRVIYFPNTFSSDQCKFIFPAIYYISPYIISLLIQEASIDINIHIIINPKCLHRKDLTRLRKLCLPIHVFTMSGFLVIMIFYNTQYNQRIDICKLGSIQMVRIYLQKLIFCFVLFNLSFCICS